MPGGPRIGVLGGTFDPFHNGHLAAAVCVRHDLDLDRVLVVVANRPWQKEGGRPISPAADRLALVEAGIAGVDGVEASDLEIRRGGVTYTVDTLEALRDDDPTATLFLVVGTDVAGELDTWHRAADLRGLADLAIVSRPGATPPAFLEGWRVEHVPIPPLAISSTEIRERVAGGAPIDGLVPPAVVREIAARGLYAPS